MISRTRLLLQLLRRRFDPCQISAWLQLHRVVTGCESVLDVGCGDASNLSLFEWPHLTGLEGYEPSYQSAKRKNTHHTVILGDVRKLDQLFVPGQFDACAALDVIEHLPKEEGFKLLRDMEKVASKVIVLTTPNGFLPQRHADRDDLQEHLSGWEPAEFEAQGYHVIGLLGPKKLRGEHHALHYHPKVFWGLVSLCGQLLWTRRHPKAAAALLAVKLV